MGMPRDGREQFSGAGSSQDSGRMPPRQETNRATASTGREVQKPPYWCSISGMILALLSDVGIQTFQVLDVGLLPFWFKY